VVGRGRTGAGARHDQWARELERARDTILPRLQLLLGPETVKGLYINA
jgi:hypothetical protein